MHADREIFIVLTDTGTVLAKLIKCFTRKELNHASIAFDASLREVYSFGRKNKHNPFIGGFVREDFRDSFFHDSACAIYRCAVSEKEYQEIYRFVMKMMHQQHRYKYHFIGLFGVVLNFHFHRQNAYFCSHFVATLFEEQQCPIVNKPAYWVTPGDLEKSPRLEKYYQGTLSEYMQLDRASERFFSVRRLHKLPGRFIRFIAQKVTG